MPIVSILGPPNAGKSTLFNRLLDKHANRSYKLGVDKKKRRRKKSRTQSLLGRRTLHDNGLAIVSATAGTTRDRRECIGRIGGTVFELWDTAGVEFALTSQQLLLEKPTNGASSAMTRQKPTSKKAPPFQESLQYHMMQQTVQAVRNSDLVFLLMDARYAGVTADLLETAKWLRHVSTVVEEVDPETGKKVSRQKPRVVVVANKLEGTQWNYEGSNVLENLVEAERRLGFGEPLALSAIHGDGIADLAVAIEEVKRFIPSFDANHGGGDDSEDDADEGGSDEDESFSEEEDESDSASEDDDANRSSGSDSESDEDDSDGDDTTVSKKRRETKKAEKPEKPLQLAILGRQNVGKSTLVNALLGQDRLLVGAMPGLTRDAISVPFRWEGRPVQIVDTAGIRKRPKRDHRDEIEDLAVQDAMRAMKIADVAVLVIDAGARMLHRQELTIADAILQEGRSIVVVANKMDLIVQEDYSKEEFVRAVRDQLEGRFPFLRKTPIVAMSSLTGECVQDLMPVVFDARKRWERTISTGQLNRWIADVRERMSPPTIGGKAVKIKYILQTKGRPPTFLLYCSTDDLPENYARFILRHFQESFQFFGMQVRLAIKKSASSNPYDTGRKRRGFGIGGHEARKQRILKERADLYRGCKTKEEGRAKILGMKRKRKKRRSRR